MAKDFKAGQIKTSKIIGKTGEKTVFYTDAESSDDSGGHAVPVGGNDVSFVFSGDDGDKGGATGGVTLFNGDIVVSGTLYAEKQVIDVHAGAGGLTVSGVTQTVGSTNTAIHIDTPADGAIVWDSNSAKIHAAGSSFNELRMYGAGGIRLNSDGGTVIGINSDQVKDTNIVISTHNSIGGIVVINEPSSGIGEAVLVNWNAHDVASGTKRSGAGNLGTDVCFHVDTSPTVGRDTAVVEGNLVISGTLSGGSPLKIGTDTRLDAVAGSTQYFNFGATDGSAGYGLRSNAGAIEFKNNAGAWAGIGSGGGGSSAGNNLYQVSDGAGGFYSAPTVIMGYDTVNKKTTLGIDHLTGGGTARFTVATESTDNATAVDIVHVATGGYQSNPALNIIANTDPAVYSPLVTINSRNDKNIIELTNGFPSSIKSSSIKYEYSDLSIKNNQINGYVALEATRTSDLYYTSGDVDVIKCIKGTVNDPTVTILTNPTSPPAAILNSEDINFYVHGVPGYLGVVSPATTSKSSAKFGGDVQVVGCVARGGILHLSNGPGTPPQSYDIPASPLNGIVPGSVGTGGFTTILNPAWVQSVIWNTAIIADTDFYTISGYPTTDITITKAGIYKISYSVNLSQIQPATNRINMRTFLRKTTGSASVLDTIPCSEAWSYGRGAGSADTVSKMTNTCTTTAEFAANDVINLNMLFLHGTRETVVEVKVRADQTWILIERIA